MKDLCFIRESEKQWEVFGGIKRHNFKTKVEGGKLFSEKLVRKEEEEVSKALC